MHPLGAGQTSFELRRVAPSETRIATLWRDGVEVPLRIEILIEFLMQRHRKVPGAKFLVFAGFPGLAKRVADFLEDQFQASSVARFNCKMPDAMKEKEVRRFKRDDLCWILACRMKPVVRGATFSLLTN